MRGDGRRVDIGVSIVLVVIAMMSTSLWYSHAWADENRPKKVLTVPPGTPRPSHTPSPIGQLPTATTPPTATSVPIGTPTTTVTLTVTPPSLAATATFTVTVENENSSESIQVGLKVSRICVAENSGTIAVGLTLNQPSEETVIVDVVSKSGGSESVANVGQDFEFINDSVFFFNGQQDALINFSILNDAIEEGDETFFLEIQGIRNSNVTIDPTAQSAEIVILDDDDQSEETSHHNCEQMPGQLANGFDIQADKDNSSFSVNGVVFFEIAIHNREFYTLTDTLLDVTIPAGMTLVVEEGIDTVIENVSGDDTDWNSIDTTWQVGGQINAAAPDGFAGEAQVQMRLGDIRPDTAVTLRLPLRISQDITFDSTTIVTGRLSALHSDNGQSWVQVTSSEISLIPTQLPPEAEPAMRLFLPIVNG